jgi:uncharacterized membrane protein (UPF0136 family)
MKMLLGFIFICLMIGTMWERQLPVRYLIPIGILAMLLMASYYYLNQA